MGIGSRARSCALDGGGKLFEKQCYYIRRGGTRCRRHGELAVCRLQVGILPAHVRGGSNLLPPTTLLPRTQTEDCLENTSKHISPLLPPSLLFSCTSPGTFVSFAHHSFIPQDVERKQMSFAHHPSISRRLNPENGVLPQMLSAAAMYAGGVRLPDVSDEGTRDGLAWKYSDSWELGYRTIYEVTPLHTTLMFSCATPTASLSFCLSTHLSALLSACLLYLCVWECLRVSAASTFSLQPMHRGWHSWGGAPCRCAEHSRSSSCMELPGTCTGVTLLEH